MEISKHQIKDYWVSCKKKTVRKQMFDYCKNGSVKFTFSMIWRSLLLACSSGTKSYSLHFLELVIRTLEVVRAGCRNCFCMENTIICITVQMHCDKTIQNGNSSNYTWQRSNIIKTLICLGFMRFIVRKNDRYGFY